MHPSPSSAKRRDEASDPSPRVELRDSHEKVAAAAPQGKGKGKGRDEVHSQCGGTASLTAAAPYSLPPIAGPLQACGPVCPRPVLAWLTLGRPVGNSWAHRTANNPLLPSLIVVAPHQRLLQAC